MPNPTSGPSCPKCGAALKDDYGMAHCPSCGTMLLIDMDGNANLGASEATVADEASKVLSNAPDLAPAEHKSDAPEFMPQEFTNFGETSPSLQSAEAFDPDMHASVPPPKKTDEPKAAADPEDEQEPVGNSDFQFSTDEESPAEVKSEPASAEPAFDAPFEMADLSVENSPEPGEDPFSAASEEAAPETAPPAEEEFSMDSMLGYQDAPPAEEIGSLGDPLGLNEYANSEVSQAKDGLLSFKILISGIDSKEIRDSLREAIEDSRFGWNASEIMSKISKGILQIEQVAPVKATILINRIKRLPVQIRWEQYAVTQMEGDAP